MLCLPSLFCSLPISSYPARVGCIEDGEVTLGSREQQVQDKSGMKLLAQPRCPFALAHLGCRTPLPTMKAVRLGSLMSRGKGVGNSFGMCTNLPSMFLRALELNAAPQLGSDMRLVEAVNYPVTIHSILSYESQQRSSLYRC